VAAAGPAASFALAGAGAAAAWLLGRLGVSSLIVASVGWLAGINVLLGLFNLLPAFPLDGGRILRAALWRHWRDRMRAAAVAARIGRAGGFALIAVGAVEFLAGGGALGGIWLALIGWFISVAAQQQPELLKQHSPVADLTAADAMSREPVVVAAGAAVAEVIELYVIPSGLSSFPVLDADGRLVGLANVRRMAELARESWATTSIVAATAPRSEIVECSPQDRLAVLAPRLERSPDRRAIVLDGTRVVGILTPSDVARAVSRAELLGQPSAAWPRAGGRDARAGAAWGSTPQR
jgi:CBS domain-containing protein